MFLRCVQRRIKGSLGALPLWRFSVSVSLFVLEAQIKPLWRHRNTPQLLFVFCNCCHDNGEADKELVDAKTRVCDLVIESLMITGGRETGRNSTTKLGQTTMLMGTSIWQWHWPRFLVTHHKNIYPAKHVTVRCGYRAMVMSYMHRKCIYIGDPD